MTTIAQIEQMNQIYQFYAQQRLLILRKLCESKYEVPKIEVPKIEELDSTDDISENSDQEIKEEKRKSSNFSMASILGENDDHCVPEVNPPSPPVIRAPPIQVNPYMLWNQMQPPAPAEVKSKRVRTIFTTEQIERLEAEFEKSQYNVGKDRVKLAQDLNLTETQVKFSSPKNCKTTYRLNTKTNLGKSMVPESPHQRQKAKSQKLTARRKLPKYLSLLTGKN